MSNWIDEIYSNVGTHIPILLVGNKSDLEHKRVITQDSAQTVTQKYGLSFIETSAMIGTNINEGVDAIVDKIYILNKLNNTNGKKIAKPRPLNKTKPKLFCFM